MARDNGGIIGPVNDPTEFVASGVWPLQEQYQAKLAGNWPITPFFSENSLRFDDGSSDYLSRTNQSSVTDNKKCTISVWVKRSGLGSYHDIIDYYGDAQNYNIISLGNDKIAITNLVSNVVTTDVQTDAVFRDTSAWYHFVIAFDTTQATATDRVKVYVNGVEDTSLVHTTSPSLNSAIPINTASLATKVGSYGSGNYFDGYMSEVIFVDGQQLDASSFGESNADGVWIPKPYEGTFGTNGFELKFTNAASLGTDSSPNGNDFTVNNLTSIDQTTDTPENNYCTLNPLVTYTTQTDNQSYSEGNTIVIPNSTDSYNTAFSTLGVQGSGKWYWEAQIVWNGTSNNANFPRTIGFVTEDYGFNYSYLGQDQESWGMLFSDDTPDQWFASHPDENNNVGGTMANGDTVNLALDLDNGYFYFGVNGTYINSGDPTSGASGTGAVFTLTATDLSKFLIPAVTNATNTTYYKFNFGNPAYSISSSNSDANGYGNFEYAVPSGYYALNTKNLAEFG